MRLTYKPRRRILSRLIAKLLINARIASRPTTGARRGLIRQIQQAFPNLPHFIFHFPLFPSAISNFMLDWSACEARRSLGVWQREPEQRCSVGGSGAGAPCFSRWSWTSVQRNNLRHRMASALALYLRPRNSWPRAAGTCSAVASARQPSSRGAASCPRSRGGSSSGRACLP